MTPALPQRLGASRPGPSPRGLAARVLAVVAVLAVLAAVGLALTHGGTRAALNLVRHGTTAPVSHVATVNRAAPIVYRPPGYGSRKLPLVVALYGAGGCPQCMEGVTNFEHLAATQGFVVAYPASDTSPPWNSPSDLSYVRNFVDQVIRHDGIDPARVYLAGFSAGGRATYQYGCALNAKLAAIAVVSSVMRGYPCRLHHPLSELTIDGGAESVALFGNSNGIPPASATAQRWRGMDGCGTGLSPAVSNGGIGGLVRQTVWGPCANGSRVGLYVLAGGYHTWPGTSSARGPDRLYNASLAIWHFFASVSAGSLRVPDVSLRHVGARSAPSLVGDLTGGSQLVTATLAPREPVVVRMQLMVAGHALGSVRRDLRPGPSRTVSLAIPAGVPAGLVRLRMVVRDAYGRSLTIVRSVRVV